VGEALRETDKKKVDSANRRKNYYSVTSKIGKEMIEVCVFMRRSRRKRAEYYCEEDEEEEVNAVFFCLKSAFYCFSSPR